MDLIEPPAPASVAPPATFEAPASVQITPETTPDTTPHPPLESVPVTAPVTATAPALPTTATPHGQPWVTPGKAGTVGVLVCTYQMRRLPMLTACLDSLAAQTRAPDEIVVMVDGTEELAAEIRAALPDGVTVECMGTNQGVSLARNEGARRLTSDWLVLLDDDAFVDPTWLERLTAPLGEPHVLGAAGFSAPVYEVPKPRWVPDEFLWAFGCSWPGLPTTISRTRNFFGGASVVDRALFLELGGFSPLFGHHGGFAGGGEEAFFCQQATRRTQGWFVFEPAAVAHHHIPADRLTWRYLLRRCYGEGVMKQRLAAELGAGSLGEETSFAKALPPQFVRYLLTGHPSRAVALAGAALAVVAGLLRGRLLGAESMRAQ